MTCSHLKTDRWHIWNSKHNWRSSKQYNSRCFDSLWSPTWQLTWSVLWWGHQYGRWPERRAQSRILAFQSKALLCSLLCPQSQFVCAEIRAVPNRGLLIFGRIRIVGPTIRPNTNTNTNTNSCNEHARHWIASLCRPTVCELLYWYCTSGPCIRWHNTAIILK